MEQSKESGILEVRRCKLHRYGWCMLVLGAVASLLVVLSIFCYAGSYHFYEDYLSVIGRTRIHDGVTGNYLASIVFNAGLVLAGVATSLYFVLRGLHARKCLGIPLAIAGGLSGILLTMTGLLPLNIWEDGHNYSIYTAGACLPVALILCGLEGDSLFSTRESNRSWLMMTIFVVAYWAILHGGPRVPMFHFAVLQQKLIILFLWFFMVRHIILLLCRTGRPNAQR